ncbi:hypothetical protein WJX79_000439 [Trebouxia sp. C0005]
MGRELRQRKPVTYNESLLSAEASSSTVSKNENTEQGSLLRSQRRRSGSSSIQAEDDCEADSSNDEGGDEVDVSDSEALSDEESDKENQPASPEAAADKTFKRFARQVPGKQKQAKGASTTGKASQGGKTSNKKAAAAPARKKKPVVLSSGSESEEEEEGPSSEDEAEGLEIERVLHGRPNPDTKQEEFLVKLKEQSIRKAKWLSQSLVMQQKPQLLRNFIQRRHEGPGDEPEELVHGILPDNLLVERVIAQKPTVHGQLYLTKWRGLTYSEATWESEADLKDDMNHVEAFKQREKASGYKDRKPATVDKVPQFLNGRMLRDYQELSLKWMMNNWGNKTNCILGDEMGLGKTAQSISTLEFQRQLCNIPGPFLIVAPLTTLGHWQREVETWTSMNVVLYNGSAADREIIRDHEFRYKSSSSYKGKTTRAAAGLLKFDVLLASYEMVRKDRKVFQDIDWETVIIDEAHRLKNTTSDTRAAVAGMTIQWLLLLTGTPVQNNMRELFGLMNLLDDEKYGDEEEFFEKFGGDKDAISLEQVQALQEEMRPILLRRMKEDVENLPEKEEVVVWVQLTHQQRAYYKALYSNQIGALLNGCNAKNLPNLRNLAMELRKVCCHPFLCNGLEEDFAVKRHAAGDAGSELDLLVQSSGKMLLLHKLLPKLKAEGHKVLIFSQFKIMMDVLEDSLRLRKYPVERIDGSVSSRDRQAAIDRYSRNEADSFVFLLSTRAGGQGITLTAADTVIIYDSDWNPQNDLQAMARCHRIGQSKEVTIYRLVCKDTYEQQVFECSSRKYGLDEAILGSMNSCGDPEQDSKKIADLLKYGAHSLVGRENEAKQEEEAFAEEDIDQILAGRSEKRQIGSRKGNTFSTATFSTNEAVGTGKNDREYWAQLMPQAVDEHDLMVAAAKAPQVLAPRRRKAVNYNEAKLHRKYVTDSESEATAAEAGSDDPDDSNAEDGPQNKGKGKKAAAVPEEVVPKWTKADVRAVEDRLLALGPHRTADVREQAGVAASRSLEEVAELEKAVCLLIQRAADIYDAKGSQLDTGMAATLAKLQPGASDGSSLAVSLNRDQSMGEAERAAHAEASTSNVGDGSADGGKTAVTATSELITPEVEKQLPRSARRALTSSELRSRLSKQGKRFQQQLTERGALHQLMTAVQSGDSDAKLQLFGITKISGQPRVQAPWWGPKDDRALLVGYKRQGGIPWLNKAIMSTVDGILSDPTLDFSVRLVQKAAPHPDQAADDSSSSGLADANPVAGATGLASCPSSSDAASAMEGVMKNESHSKEGRPKPDDAADEKRLIQLEEGKWKALSSAVVQRLKRLMAGVGDPEYVRRHNEARAEQARLAAIQKAQSKRLRQMEKQRRRHEQAAMFGSEQREAAAQQLNLQPAPDKSSSAEADQDRPDSSDIGRKSSAAVAATAERDHHEHEAVGSANQNAAGRPGTDLPAAPKASNYGAQQMEHSSAKPAAAAGQGRPMSEYMPAMPTVRADRSGSESGTPQELQLRKRSSSKSAFKQTTLMFGKKPRPIPTTSSPDIVDLSDL